MLYNGMDMNTIDYITNTLVRHPPREAKPSLSEFLSLIEEATKADHQIYSTQKLAPLRFGLNANLPGIINFFRAPYYLITTLAAYLKGKIHKTVKSLKASNKKMTSYFLNFVQATITPLAYLITIAGGVSLGLTILTPVALLLTFVVSCLEIYVNSKHFFAQKKFLKAFDLSVLKEFSQAPTLLTRHELIKTLGSLINTITEESPCSNKHYQNHLISVLHEIRLELKQSILSLSDAKKELAELLPEFKRAVVVKKLQVLEKNFFTLSEKTKSSLLGKASQHYIQYSYSEALYHSLSGVQEAFTAKKIFLAGRVQPWFTLKILH